MKKIAKTLLMVLLVLVVATSCGKDEEEPIGIWAPMKWKVPGYLVQIQEGVYQVPLTGGSYTFICENYVPRIVSLYEIGPYVTYETPGLGDTIYGEWCNVKCVNKYVTITFSPTTEEDPHDFEVTFTAGDIFYQFLFYQRNRLY
jgi:hypothetical protein